jgi:protein SCO1/2
VSLRTIFAIPLLLLVLAAGGQPSNQVVAQLPAKQAKVTRKVNHYACPMHPEVSSKRRGKCPKCGMRLRLVEEKAVATPLTAPAASPASMPELTASFTSVQVPDLDVVDQNGRHRKFNTDLIKGKTVAINFIFTTCTTVCPPLTATFRRLQQQIITEKLPVELISISVDPTVDTPERLRDFGAKFKAEPGWTFVTGEKATIDSILQSLGSAVAVKTDHTPMILIGNDASGYWTRAYGLSSPSNLMKLITEAANRK